MLAVQRGEIKDTKLFTERAESYSTQLKYHSDGDFIGFNSSIVVGKVHNQASRANHESTLFKANKRALMRVCLFFFTRPKMQCRKLILQRKLIFWMNDYFNRSLENTA